MLSLQPMSRDGGQDVRNGLDRRGHPDHWVKGSKAKAEPEVAGPHRRSLLVLARVMASARAASFLRGPAKRHRSLGLAAASGAVLYASVWALQDRKLANEGNIDAVAPALAKTKPVPAQAVNWDAPTLVWGSNKYVVLL